MTRELLAQPAFAALAGGEVFPGAEAQSVHNAQPLSLSISAPGPSGTADFRRTMRWTRRCGGPRRASGIFPARRGWAGRTTRPRWWTRRAGCTGWAGSGFATRRSCRGSPTASARQCRRTATPPHPPGAPLESLLRAVTAPAWRVGNTNSPTIMLAEKISAAMLGEAPLTRDVAAVWQNPGVLSASSGGERSIEV